MQSNRAYFANPDRINLEIRRRALAIAQAKPTSKTTEDPYTIASRQMFEELLSRAAEEQNAA